jgi:hypothetical protein
LTDFHGSFLCLGQVVAFVPVEIIRLRYLDGLCKQSTTISIFPNYYLGLVKFYDVLGSKCVRTDWLTDSHSNQILVATEACRWCENFLSSKRWSSPVTTRNTRGRTSN